ncbi:MAG: HD domain-containing protein [Oscillospiraceae bacterium]|nr:HD domain-containing protein [Oscillospiraceae bacterium]
MTNEMMERMQTHIIKLEGNITHVKRVLLLSKLIAEKENIAYDENILAFAAYFHDMAAYPYYSRKFSGEYDHALESSKMIPDLAKEYGFDDVQIEKIVEAVKYHDKVDMGNLNETRLIRNADGLDYLGYMAVARDFTKFRGDFAKTLDTLKRRKAQFLPIIDLPYAKELAVPRVDELDHFIARFEEECYGIY